MAFEIAKAGWLFRESSFLRRWKKNWFVLYMDGTLRYFDNPDCHTAEEAYQVTGYCIRVITGEQVQNVTPPDGGIGRSCLLKVDFSNTSLILCAESPDDMRAWQLALEQARIPARSASAPPPYSYNAPPPYPGYYQNYQDGQSVVYYPGQTVYTAPGGYVPPSNSTIIIQQDPYYYRGGYYGGGDFAMGALTGAAVGTMMMTPLLWGPLLW